MLFNFIISYGESNVGELRIRTIDGDSLSSAIEVYILADNIEYVYVIHLIMGALGSNRKSNEFKIASSLSDKAIKSMGFELGDIDDNNVDQDEYLRFLDENSEEISELINEIADGTNYFGIDKVDVVLTKPLVKSASIPL